MLYYIVYDYVWKVQDQVLLGQKHVQYVNYFSGWNDIMRSKSPNNQNTLATTKQQPRNHQNTLEINQNTPATIWQHPSNHPEHSSKRLATP